MPPSGSGAPLRTTPAAELAGAPAVDARALPHLELNGLWDVRGSASSDGAHGDTCRDEIAKSDQSAIGNGSIRATRVPVSG